MKKLVLLIASLAAVVLAVVSAQAADVTVGQSGWNWGNPQPQGNTLRTVEFAGGRGYAAGQFGTLLRTDDGGRNWIGIPTGITADLARIRAVDQNTVVIGSGCVLRRSDDGGTTFTRLKYTGSEASCPSTIASLYFPSAQVGYVVASDGNVVTTANGGQSFSGRQAVPGTEATHPTGPAAAPTDVWFTDTNTGFAITKGPGGGNVYRTTDGGNTWFPRTTTGAGLNGLYFPDPSIGYAVGDGNTVIKTTDGGETWNPMPVDPSVPNNDLTSIRCSTTVSCLIATASGDRVLRTTDGGTTITGFSPSTRKIFAIAFASASSAVGVGERGATVLSTNADAESPSFVPVGDQPLSGAYDRIRATSATLVYAPGDNGKLTRSTDGGHHWGTIQVPTSEDLRDSWFVNETDGFVIDTAGKALATVDGGGSWTLLDTGTTAVPSAVYAPDSNLVLLFGPRGVRRSTDGGQTPFDAVDSKAARTATLVDYDRTSSSALYAFGPKALIRSTNGGASWKKVKGPVKKPRYQKVDFVSSKVGYALMTNGRVYSTRNGGKKWRETGGVGTASAYDISFGDARSGFLSIPSFGPGNRDGGGSNGWVLRTSDGGATWRPQLIDPAPLATRGLAAAAGNTAFALAAPTDLFYTTFGGDQGEQTTVTIRSKTKRVTKNKTVKISGRMSPAVAAAQVVISVRDPKNNGWHVIDVATVSSAGTFTSSKRVSRTTQFVAQWRGDADHNGDGSPAIKVVKVKSAKKKR